MLDTNINANGRFLRKRQSSSGFVSGNGQAVDSCSNAVVYNLIQGQLLANTTNSATQFSANPSDSYANFTPSANPGSITTVFSVDSQNNLLWGNTAFYNNAARFCVLPDGTIVAVYIDPTQAPANCVFVALSMSRVSSCAGAANGAYITGPTGAQGVSGGKQHLEPKRLRLRVDEAPGISGIPGQSGAPGVSGQPGISGGEFHFKFFSRRYFYCYSVLGRTPSVCLLVRAALSSHHFVLTCSLSR